MSVKNDASGRRWVEMELEVPGTPEEVWHAIATGPGISSWFVPTEVEEREGGALVFHLGPGMDSPGIVTAWEPPHRFVYEEREWSPGAPPVATECLVEARGGGVCVMRMVHSLFTSKEDWDDQLAGFETGWPPFFHALRLYLTHFRGQRCSPLRLLAITSRPEPEAWAELAGALGLQGAAPGERREASGSGVPPFAGVVEKAGGAGNPHEAILLLEEPALGVALVGAYTWGGHVHASASFYLFGERGAAALARDEPRWQAWMSERFPPAAPAGSPQGELVPAEERS